MVKPPNQKLTSSQILRQYRSTAAKGKQTTTGVSSERQQSSEKEQFIKLSSQEHYEPAKQIASPNKSPRIPENIEFNICEANEQKQNDDEKLLASIKAENINLLKELLSTGEFRQYLESESELSNLTTAATSNTHEDPTLQENNEEVNSRATAEAKKKYEGEIMKYKHALEESKRQLKLVELQCTKKVSVFQRNCNEVDKTNTALKKDLSATQEKLNIMEDKENNLIQTLSKLQQANRYAVQEKERFETDVVNCQDTIESIIKSKHKMEDELSNIKIENSNLKEKIMESERKNHGYVMQLEKSKKSSLKIEQTRGKAETDLKDCKKVVDVQKSHEKKLEKELIELKGIIDNLQKENESLKVEEDRFMVLQNAKDILQGVIEQSTESFESCLNAIQSKVLDEREKSNELAEEVQQLKNTIDEETCYHDESKVKLQNEYESNTKLESEKELIINEIVELRENYHNKVNEFDLIDKSREECFKELDEMKEIHQIKLDDIDLLEESKKLLLEKICDLQRNFDDIRDKLQRYEDTNTDLNNQIISLQGLNEVKNETILEMSMLADAAQSICTSEVNKNSEMLNNLAASLMLTSKALEVSSKEGQRLKKALVDNKKRYKSHSFVKSENALLSSHFNTHYLHLTNEENQFDFINVTNEFKQVIGIHQAQIENLEVEADDAENLLAKTKESYVEDQFKLKKLFNERENELIKETMRVGTMLKSQIAQLQSEINDKVAEIAAASDIVLVMEDEVAAAKSDFEVQKKTTFDLQSALQEMNEEYNDLQHSLQMVQKDVGKEASSIHEEFTMIKDTFSDLKDIISNNDQDMIDISNELEQVKMSYEKEKEEYEITHTELQYELQVASRNLDESTTTKYSLVSKSDELQATVKSLQKDLKALKLHSKKQQEIICELKNNFSNIISRFETNLTKSFSISTKSKIAETPKESL